MRDVRAPRRLASHWRDSRAWLSTRARVREVSFWRMRFKARDEDDDCSSGRFEGCFDDGVGWDGGEFSCFWRIVGFVFVIWFTDS